MNKKVSIIIPVCDDLRIKRCLESLQKQTFPFKQMEIIVIENSNKQILNSILTKHAIIYLYLSEKNMAKSRNIGLSKASGEFVLFTDADCVADKNWVSEMVNFLENHKIAGIGGVVERFNPQTNIEKMGKNLAWGQKDLQYLQILELPYVVFANAGFRKRDLDSVGGFDNDLLSGNDVDICWKLGLQKKQLGICPTAIIYHENRKSLKKYAKAYFRYAVYQALLFKKYRTVAKKRWMINTYPINLFFNGLKNLPQVFKKNYRPLYDLIEAIFIIIGQSYGSLRFRILYL